MKKRYVDGRLKVRFRSVDKKKVAIRYLIIFAIVLAIAVLALYNLFFKSVQCLNFECFDKSMRACESANYVNNDQEASWRYDIIGPSGNDCVIVVKLLSARVGELKLERLEGFDMECFYPLGDSAYPEKDMRLCHGRLKEEFQGIVIERLHKVVIENLEDISIGLVPEGL